MPNTIDILSERPDAKKITMTQTSISPNGIRIFREPILIWYNDMHFDVRSAYINIFMR